MIGDVLLYNYPVLQSEVDGYMDIFREQLYTVAELIEIHPGNISHLRSFRRYEEKYITLARKIKRTHPDVFESMRQAIGRAHQQQGEILLAMKEAVRIRLTSPTQAKQILDDILKAFALVKELDLSDDQTWLFQAQIGQEIGDLHFHNVVFAVTLFRGTPPPPPPFPEQLGGITPQAWLSGIADTPGELSKTLLYFTSIRLLPPAHEMELRLRYVAIVRVLADFLNGYISRYGLVIDNSRPRFWASRFRAIVARAEGNLPHELRKIEELKRMV